MWDCKDTLLGESALAGNTADKVSLRHCDCPRMQALHTMCCNIRVLSILFAPTLIPHKQQCLVWVIHVPCHGGCSKAGLNIAWNLHVRRPDSNDPHSAK